MMNEGEKEEGGAESLLKSIPLVPIFALGGKK